MKDPGFADSSPRSLTTQILERCRGHDFALAGVCNAEPTAHVREIREWIARGSNGDMAWLEARLDERLDPGVYLPGARSIICVADRYHDGGRDSIDRKSPPRGRIARYARGRDYHKVLKKRLVTIAKVLQSEHPGHDFRPCVDTAPLLEREHAMRAGLGLVGKNTLLIEPGIGSWMLLGAIVTTLPLAPTPPSERTPDPCGSCTRCIDACPTSAITPFSVDATRCIAYSTIEHRQEADPAVADRTGSWLFGCDICQEVCPHGQQARRGPLPEVHPGYESRHDSFDLLEVLDWTEERAMELLAGTAARRATLDMWKRNALICAADALVGRPDGPGCRALHDRVVEIAEDGLEDSMVRQAARRVLQRIAGSDPV
jgi:epoxyqueuosine reductase